MWNRETKSAMPSIAPAPVAAQPAPAPTPVPVKPVASVATQPAPIAPPAQPAPAPAVYAPPAKAKGSTLVVKGELNGAEDLMLEGKVQGKISLPDHVLTIGPGSQVAAEIQARVVVLHGHITGNVTASERMEIKGSGRMEGDLITPRVMMADGATFNGRLETRVPGKSANPKSKPELVAV